MNKAIDNIFKYVLTSICLYISTFAFAGEARITMYKQAGCMCCDKHADILEQEGFDVDIRPLDNLDLFKAKLGIPGEFAGCHTMLVGDYIVEGHVPGEMIHRLLEEKPDIRPLITAIRGPSRP